MNVSRGDRAVIVFSVNPSNIGRVVNVSEYIGKFKEGEQFEAFGMTSTCVVHDHYWWIEADDLTIQLGPSPKAYIADSWLRRLVDPKKKVSTKAEKELDMFN
jgi:hypothetical protein